MAAAVAAAERWGELEAVVANAGVIAGGAPAWELARRQERAVARGLPRGVMVAARAGIPALLRRPAPRRGRFVATASAAATRGLPGLAAYCAAKAGVAGFVRALAADLRGTGITANAVAPGSTRTPILDESARLYDLGSGRGLRPPAAARAPARARRGRGDDRLAARPRRLRGHRRAAAGRRRPLDLGVRPVRLHRHERVCSRRSGKAATTTRSATRIPRERAVVDRTEKIPANCLLSGEASSPGDTERREGGR